MGSEPVFWRAVCRRNWLGEAVSGWGWLGGLPIVVSAWWVTMPRAADAARQVDQNRIFVRLGRGGVARPASPMGAFRDCGWPVRIAA
jgi:hypothetical protein